MTVRERVKHSLYALDPRLGLVAHAWYYYAKRSEPEIRLVPELCRADETSIDVGAHVGIYTYFLRRHSKDVIAIEPNPQLAAQLRRTFGGRVDVREVALSSRPGEAKLHVPRIDGSQQPGRATIDPDNALFAAPGDELTVPRATLDELIEPTRRVAFVKIDVEGHELSVLEGARHLLERDAPSLLIEIEERHHKGALAGVQALLRRHGYRGFFLERERLRPIERFDFVEHQVIGKTPYIYNFIFARRPEMVAALARRD